MASFKWEDAPATSFNVAPGQYPMVIKEAKKITTSNGYKAIQLVWESLGTPAFKINYDNCIYGTKEADYDFTVKAVSFGFAKLRAINEATVNLPECDPDVLVRTLPGQKALVTVKMDSNNKYPEVDGTNIEKLEASTPAVETAPQESFNIDEDSDPFALD